jgi:acyl-CoA thioesterase-1
MIHRYVTRFLLVAGAAACGGEPPPPPAEDAVVVPLAAPPRVSDDARPAIVFLGTSLTAGLGLEGPQQAYPALIQARLDSAGLAYRVVNAGVSGETSAGALRRVDWVMSQGDVAVLVVETGANDGLRGQDPDSLRANLEAIFARARQQNPPPKLILAGMEAPPNLGRDYTTRFRAVYPDVARAHGATLIPFLLDGVAGVESLNQADGIHPTAEGQRRMAEIVWEVLRRVLEER